MLKLIYTTLWSGKMEKEKLNSVFEQLFKSNPSNKIPPSRKKVIQIIKDVHYLMFPEYFPSDNKLNDRDLLYSLSDSLKEQITIAFEFSDVKNFDADKNTEEIILSLPEIKQKLIKDMQALYEGDPAAVCKEEIILSYPGFYATSIYRLAHEFYVRGIPLISRLMTEFAHEKTGIDIHAGATIGEYFFIDHGTGIVIGETTTIGDRVKLYQGVTLGAKSFELDEFGNPIKGIKRHPDIGNGVVIYANATILGGDTKIGDGAVIGGNVWITETVEPNTVVYYGRAEHIKRKKV
jgi:serine O-acetyltransferase